MSDLIIKNARIYEVDSHVADNKKTKSNSAVATNYDAKGNFVFSEFYESHIHLDKACILGRCNVERGTLKEAVDETGKAKEGLTFNSLHHLYATPRHKCYSYRNQHSA